MTDHASTFALVLLTQKEADLLLEMTADELGRLHAIKKTHKGLMGAETSILFAVNQIVDLRTKILEAFGEVPKK